MKFRLLLLFLICSFLQNNFAWATDQKLMLSLGKTHSLKIASSARVWIQDKEILKAEALGNQLFLKPLHLGKTFVQVGENLYVVHVLHPTQFEGFAKFRTFTESLVGMQLTIENGDVYVSGHLYRLKDWIEIARVSQEKQINYLFKATLSEELQNEAREYFSQLCKKNNLRPPTLIFDQATEIHLNVPELDFKKYQNLLSPFGVAVIKDASSLELAPTIKVEITVAEIKKDLSIKYGIKPPGGYSATILGNGKTETSPLELNVAALENHGMGKVLASPNLICRSGKEAEFLAGGEFPIKILNFKAQDVVWKRYGIMLKVKPKADSSGHMSITIETEVTTIDDSRKVDDIPGLITNRVSSHFDLTKPQTIALSGLLKNDTGKNSEGLPILSRLPILGALFSSKDFRDNRTELVIFVRPSILTEDQESNNTPQHLQTIREKSW